MSDYEIPFHPLFSTKDILGFLMLILSLLIISLMLLYDLGDVENFIHSNPLVTPIHIQPEWYFLFAYAILRSIPNKLEGVIALLLSIVILLTLPLSMSRKYSCSAPYYLTKIMFWTLVANVFLLTWIGARPVEDPHILIGQILTISYFSIYAAMPLFSKMSDNH